jgi:hypothetical protein
MSEELHTPIAVGQKILAKQEVGIIKGLGFGGCTIFQTNWRK